MRQIVFFIFIFFTKTFTEIHTYNLEQFSRTIQVDALLVEWKSENSKKINNFTLDAGMSAEDFIGYIHFPLLENDDINKIRITTRNTDFNREITLDSIFQFEDIALDFVVIKDSSRAAIIEWQFPLINFISKDSDSLNVLLEFIGSNDSLINVIKFEGKKNQNLNSGSNTLISQVILILVLLIIFIFMKKKVRKKFSN